MFFDAKCYASTPVFNILIHIKNLHLFFQKDHILLDPTGSDISNCLSKGKTQVNRTSLKIMKILLNETFVFCSQLFDCRNHIRVVQSMDNGNRLYVCGTNAHNPKDYVIYVRNGLYCKNLYNRKKSPFNFSSPIWLLELLHCEQLINIMKVLNWLQL